MGSLPPEIHVGEITLFPGHLVARWYHEEETVQPAGAFDLAKYLLYFLQIDPEVTFGDLCRLLDRDDVAFLEAVLGERVAPVLEEARLPAESVEGGRVEFLCVSNAHEDGRLRRELHGWGSWGEPYEGAWEEHPDWPREGALSVSLTPVNRLLDVPLRYDPALAFRDSDGVEEYRTSVGITLIEFLKAIFFDLTFYGSPAERDEVRTELDRRMDEIERGEVEMIPAEEVFREFRERFGLDEEG